MMLAMKSPRVAPWATTAVLASQAQVDAPSRAANLFLATGPAAFAVGDTRDASLEPEKLRHPRPSGWPDKGLGSDGGSDAGC